MNVAIPVGKRFLSLLDECFPKTNPLSKFINRHTVKVSFRCMANMKSQISKHNSKIISEPLNQALPPCNCRADCPLPGQCRIQSVIYKATVVSDNNPETYTGLTSNEFKVRVQGHNSDFRHSYNRTKTTLSGHIWNLKDRGKNYEVKWDILKQVQAFNQITQTCLLCLNEKLHILKHPEDSTFEFEEWIL